MAEFKLTQTGQQVQADLDKIEAIHSNDNTFTGNNTFTQSVNIGNTNGDKAVYGDGEITFNNIEFDFPSTKTETDTFAMTSDLATFSYDASTGTLAITKE